MMPHNTTESVRLEQSLEVFPFLDGEDCTILRSYIAPCRVAQGENLFTVGDDADSLFFLVTGRLAVKKQTGFGRNSQVVGLLQPYAPVGEASLAGAGSGKRKTTVCAIEDSSLFMLNNKTFELLKAEHPELAAKILQHLLFIACLRLEKCSSRLSHVL